VECGAVEQDDEVGLADAARDVVVARVLAVDDHEALDANPERREGLGGAHGGHGRPGEGGGRRHHDAVRARRQAERPDHRHRRAE
jgi:hypothetical protein